MPTLGLLADLSKLALIRDFVSKTCRELGLDGQGLYDLELAVDEACTNVVQHAYDGKGGQIEITVERFEDSIQVRIRDWGRAFDPATVPVPDVTASLAERRLGGLGLFLMRNVMDRVDFEFDAKDGNTLTMVKELDGRE